jgi:hypothetical protein
VVGLDGLQTNEEGGLICVCRTISTPQSEIRNAIINPQSALPLSLRNPQSEIRNAIFTPQSAIRNPKSAMSYSIRIPQFKIRDAAGISGHLLDPLVP